MVYREPRTGNKLVRFAMTLTGVPQLFPMASQEQAVVVKGRQ